MPNKKLLKYLILDMIEVEIKARCPDIAKTKENLEELGAKFTGSEYHADVIFGHEKFLDSEHKAIEGGYIARIRQKNDKTLLEFKEVAREKGALEIGATITDINAAKKFLEKIGFIEAFTVAKKREHYSFKGLTICLDEVEKLGRFIEVEKMVSAESEKESAWKECLGLLQRIVPGVEVEKRKYGDMMQELINARKAKQ